MTRLLRTQWVPLFAAVVIASVVLSFMTKQFASSFNVYVILQTAAVDTIIGLSQMLVLAVGDMSLAVGGIAGLVTIVAGNLFQVQHWPLGPVIVASLLIGLLCGLLNGFIIARTGLSGFIVTLATGSAFTGVAYGVTSSVPYSNIPSGIVSLGQGRASFFPYVLFVAAAAAAVIGAGLHWLPTGRTLLAVGGNREAAILSGLSRQRAVIVAHGLSGVLAGVAAVIYIGVLSSATPATGSDWLVISFAVPIIGGTALTGGEASASGCFVAAVVLATISDALIVFNINTDATEMAEGLLIFAAVLAGRLGQRAQLSGRRQQRDAERQGRSRRRVPSLRAQSSTP